MGLMRIVYMSMEHADPASEFYGHCMQVLEDADVPFLVGGAYALRVYTGIIRDTKDFDIMLRASHVAQALSVLRDAGYDAEVVFPHWLAKAHHGESFMDIIYSSGNGLCVVDDAWFRSACERTLMGRRVNICPPEEMIWQKAYIMERERFDGADIAHLLLHCAKDMDWQHLLHRFHRDPQVLLSHLLLFEFIYPSKRNLIPSEVMESLLEARKPSVNEAHSLCNGTLLSRAQYLPDVERWGFQDARLVGDLLSPEEKKIWTNAISNGTPTA